MQRFFIYILVFVRFVLKLQYFLIIYVIEIDKKLAIIVYMSKRAQRPLPCVCGAAA